MNKLLWTPSKEVIEQANMSKFLKFVNERHSLKLGSYDALYEWSVKNIPDFWIAVWEFVQIKASKQNETAVDNLRHFPGTKWFESAQMNFAENLLRYRDNHIAFIFKGEDKQKVTMTYNELYDAVARLAMSLRNIGVEPGDRVVAYMPNLIETAIAMLATTSIGAIWSSCATDLGASAALDRLGQVAPKVLFTVDGYYYKGKAFDSLVNAAEIARGIPSLAKVVVVKYTNTGSSINKIPRSVYYNDFISSDVNLKIKFEQLPFNHPVYIMFSSGTTGKPKCMVQGAGGILINHLKELIIHADLKREDTILYITTCSWMMWNWLISSLGAGATIVLYDGNPAYPQPDAMWKIIQDERVTIFGTSASYINYLKSEKMAPGKEYDLSLLREICQTGSPLSADGFEYVYQAIKKDVHFNSIAGGTDINGCFAIGNPTVSVYAGELQRWGLGMKMQCYDEKGQPIYDQMGELVCEAPVPSMPLYFWDDNNNVKYHDAYFNVFPGVWRHGDFVLVNSKTHGITFFGRSDALLKPSGVRIGTAEIYNIVEEFKEISDSLAVGQEWKGDQRILLFVKLAKGSKLTDELRNVIKKTLREKASPRHVPARIIEVPDIPYTLNGKKVEIAVTNILHGRPVLNKQSLANPDSLIFFEKNLKEFNKE